MLWFYLHYVIYPFLFCGMALLILALAAKKFPEFRKWVNEVWPNQSQKEALVILAVIGLFLWGLFR
jgi:hypothetical protein